MKRGAVLGIVGLEHLVLSCASQSLRSGTHLTTRPPSFIHSFSQNFSSTYHMPGALLDAGDIAVNKTFLALNMRNSRWQRQVVNKYKIIR